MKRRMPFDAAALAELLLRTAFSRDAATSVLGDLLEEVALRRVTKKPLRFPRAWLIGQALLYVTQAHTTRRAASLRRPTQRSSASVLTLVRPSFRWLDDSWLDFKLAGRMLSKYPGLSIVGGLGLAVAIAISGSFYAFLDAYLYSTLPIDQGERVVALENQDTRSNQPDRRSLHDFLLWREDLQSVEHVAAFSTVERNLIVPGGTVELVQIAQITASAFRITKVPPLLGRPLLDADERISAPAVLVIGFDVWQSRFGSDGSVIGREVRLGNTPHTIVGVMPEGYKFPVNDRYWVPLRLSASAIGRGLGPELYVFGRLAPGVTVRAAQAELTAIGRQAAAMFPATNAHLEPHVIPYTHPYLGLQDASNWEFVVLQAMLTLLLVIVAINVAILIYARTATRLGEIAVRTALGAGRSRIVRQLFTEALALSALAAVVGVVLIEFGIGRAHAIVEAEGRQVPYWVDSGWSFGTPAYIAVLAIAAAIIAGVIPGLHATGRRTQSMLRELGGVSSPRLGRMWTLLIITQVALTVAALPVAVAMGWNSVSADARWPAFAAAEFLAVRLSTDIEPPPNVDPLAFQRDRAARALKVRSDVVSRLERESWVADVTLAAAAPNQEQRSAVELEGLPSGSGVLRSRSNRVTPDFFDAFGVSVLAGRALTAADTSTSNVVVDRAFVQRVLGGGSALGRRVRYIEPDAPNRTQPTSPPRWYDIVGVVSDLQVRPFAPEKNEPAIFHAMAADHGSLSTVLVRVRSAPASMFIGSVRKVAASIDPTVRLFASPLTNLYRQQNIAVQLVALAVGLVIVSVLLLSAAGIYALMSFAVAQRRKEIGIRAALGADAGRLLAAVFSRSAAQLGAGVAVGVAIALVMNRVSDGAFLGDKGTVFLPVMAGVMIVVGMLAALGPARRGLRIQPTQALREH